MEQLLWIFLSPHLDDAALSCGGMIWEQVLGGAKVGIWTICAADPPPGSLSPFALSMHARWGTKDDATSIRRGEDILAARKLGAGIRHLDFVDCIYRRLPVTGEPVISGEDDLWQPLHREELPLVDALTAQLTSLLPESARLVIPIGIGRHVDHRLTRSAAERLPNQRYYYADFPYAAEVDIQEWVDPGWEKLVLMVSPPALNNWQEAVAAYSSQISSFWESEDHMRQALKVYWQNGRGCSLYRG